MLRLSRMAINQEYKIERKSSRKEQSFLNNFYNETEKVEVSNALSQASAHFQKLNKTAAKARKMRFPKKRAKYESI